MTTVVKIYASWCIHCIMMKEEWEKLASMLKTNKDIKVLDIEQKQKAKLKKLNKELSEPIEINYYPTIAKIENDEIMYYNGPRTSKEIYEWVTGQEMIEEKNKKKENKKSLNKTVKKRQPKKKKTSKKNKTIKN